MDTVLHLLLHKLGIGPVVHREQKLLILFCSVIPQLKFSWKKIIQINSNTCVDLFRSYYIVVYNDHCNAIGNWVSEYENLGHRMRCWPVVNWKGIQRNENSFCWCGRIEKAFLQSHRWNKQSVKILLFSSHFTQRIFTL